VCLAVTYRLTGGTTRRARQRILDEQYRKMLSGARPDVVLGPGHPVSPATMEMRRLTLTSLQVCRPHRLARSRCASATPAACA
jgi:hypothetical protein